MRPEIFVQIGELSLVNALENPGKGSWSLALCVCIYSCVFTYVPTYVHPNKYMYMGTHTFLIWFLFV